MSIFHCVGCDNLRDADDGCDEAPGDPLNLICVECMQDDGIPPPPREPVLVEYTFTAKFDSTCPECLGHIHADHDRVAKLSDERYVHAQICAVEACSRR